LWCAVSASAQTKPTAEAPQQPPAVTQPKPAAPATRKPAPSAPAITLAVTVTDGRGAPLSGVMVRASGTLDREGKTESGTVRFEGLRPGPYRLRFTHADYITLERDVTLPTGQRTLDQHVMLSNAEKPPPPPPPVPAPAEPKPAPLPPPGKAVTVSVPDFVEQNLIGNSQPQKVSAVACSGLLETVLWQVREPWDNRQHAGSDAMLYVVGGEGTLRMNDRDIPLQAGRFVAVPRNTSYALSRRGRNPVILLATLGGEACK
jgi:mannose-6-phosphate isomerase-like protein (cupin superfamily)